MNNNEATNNLHLLASAGLDHGGQLNSGDLNKESRNLAEESGLEDADSNTSTPRKRKRSSDTDSSKMQTDVVRVPGLSSDLQQQITKFDSSEFDVSISKNQKVKHLPTVNSVRVVFMSQFWILAYFQKLAIRGTFEKKCSEILL